MQKKIESFFKSSLSPSSSNPNSIKPTSDFVDFSDRTTAVKTPEILVTYTRQPILHSQPSPLEDGLIVEEEFEEQMLEREKSEAIAKKEKVLNKKRSYAQFHLELGQSDFLLHSCKICGVKYAKGDEVDEKVHSTFHKNFTLGIPFKGWRQERVICLPSLEKNRIVLVLNSDPLAQRKKVQEVVKMMEIELGEGWIFDEQCKLQVYLFISSQRVAGCVVAEPINTAYKIIPDSADKISNDACVKEAKPKSTILRFGEVCFQREVYRKGGAVERLVTSSSNALGSIICEEEPVLASCGVRAIWVSPSNRRKHIATHLLDAVRNNFYADHILEPSQLAFSSPTSAGKALVSKYTGTKCFLVYRS